MSATIKYRPTELNAGTIGVGAPSRFIGIMEKEFYFPCTLTENDIPRLRAMANVWGETDESNPFTQIVDLIETHKSIDLWAAY